MKRIKSWLIGGLILCFCTGCSLDVEPLLQPPKIGGEQQAVQTALDTYVRDTVGTGARYTPAYPLEGRYTSAFLLCDDRGYPVDEGADATLAVAFYALASESETTRINLLHRSGDLWVSVADTAVAGMDIRQVAFGDLDGDDTAELITGWTGYNNRSYPLMVYELTDGLSLVSEKYTYTAFYVGDVTAQGHDSLMLFQAMGAESVTATLVQMQKGGLTAKGTVALDGGIQQFGGMTLCRLAAGVHGLYVECYKGGTTTVTELIYYDQTGLHAPFYNPDTNDTAVTTRPIRLAAGDVDGDAMVEIPVVTALPGHTVDEIGGAVTQWRAWDYATGQWQNRARTLVNTADGYMVALGDAHVPATTYDETTRTLVLQDPATGLDWLWLTVGQPLEDAPAEGLESMILFRMEDSTDACYAWYDPQQVEAEKVSYIVSPLSVEGG